MLDTVITVTLVASTVFTICLLLLPSTYYDDGSISVQILVLGDIGRSPRMQYHALSIAKHGGNVQLIGYLESEPIPALIDNPQVTIIPLTSPPRSWQTSNRLAFLVFAPLKVVFQVFNLWRVLSYRSKASKWMLVQNPPSIPTLAIAAIICFFRSSRLVIDWHNYGYTILAMKLSDEHPLVRFSHIYEKFFASTASSHIVVTQAMANSLRSQFALETPVHVLNDRPASIFQPMSKDKRALFIRNSPTVAEHSKALLAGKRRLLVSSTSWTPDEDFGILITALCKYSVEAASSRPNLPEIATIITGKGPQKDSYLRKIAELKKEGKLEKVSIESAWLSFKEYAALLGSADLGVSLHTSSSGVDLPMKVVDMFGSGLPVVGWSKFEAWPELVTEKVNGLGFTNSQELSECLMKLFEPGDKQLEILKQGALAESTRRWDEEWDPVAGRLFGLID